MATTTSTNIFGSLPDSAVKRTVKSQNKFIKGIAYPLAKSRTKKVFGDIKQVINVKYFASSVNKELILGMMRQLFLTRKGERVMNPSFGLDLKNYIFSPLDITTFEIIRAEILSQMRTFLPFIEVAKLNVQEAPPAVADHGLMVKLTCKIRDINFIEPFEVEVKVG